MLPRGYSGGAKGRGSVTAPGRAGWGLALAISEVLPNLDGSGISIRNSEGRPRVYLHRHIHTTGGKPKPHQPGCRGDYPS